MIIKRILSIILSLSLICPAYAQHGGAGVKVTTEAQHPLRHDADRLRGWDDFSTPIVSTAGASFATVTQYGITLDETYLKLNNTSAYNEYVFPSVDGSDGNVIKTDGAGNLSWTTDETGAAGDHSTLTNLNWADALHTFDTNLSIGPYAVDLQYIATPAAPSASYITVYAVASGENVHLAYEDQLGTEYILTGGAGGGGASTLPALTDVDDALVYTDGFILKADGSQYTGGTYSHTNLDDIGTNTHASIDTHIADVTNPHSVTAAQAGAVSLTGDQTIYDEKTFASSPQCTLTADSPNDLVNKNYVDSFAQGLLPKGPCVAATTTAQTLATDFENGDTIDGITLATGDRVLIKDQADETTNGIYTVNASGAPTRATDYDEDSEVQEGTFTYINDGTVNDNTQWVQYTVDPVIGVNDLLFRLLPTPISYTASNGLTLDGADFQLGGTLTENTTITHSSYDLTHNLDSTGDFEVHDNGTPAFIVGDDGRTRVGGTSEYNGLLNITPTTSLRGLVIRGVASQTSEYMMLQNSSAQEIMRYDSGGRLRVYSRENQNATPIIYGYDPGTTQQSRTSGTADESFDNRYEAIKFTAASDLNIASVGIRLKRTGTITNLTAGIRAYIYSDNAGQPGTQLSGSTYSTTQYGRISTSYATENFYVGNISLSASTDYWIVLYQTAAPVGGTVEIQYNAAGTNEHAYADLSKVWTTESSKQCRYYIYGRTGYGVDGYSMNNYGVYGNSVNRYGVYGYSENGYGGYFNSPNNVGVYGVSTYTYGGYFSSSYGNAIYGSTTSGYGLYTSSSTGTACRASTTSGYGGYFSTTSGTALYASTDTGSGIYVYSNNATGNGLQELLRLRRNTSGTAAAGLGAYNDWELEDAGGTNRTASRWTTLWTDATAAHAYADIVFNIMANNSLTEKVRFTSDGLVKSLLGYGIKDTSGTYYTYIKGGNIASDITYTLPTAYAGSDNLPLISSTAGVLSYNDQALLTTSAPTFATVDTGQGANELYDMDQNVLTSSDVVFNQASGVTVRATNLRTENYTLPEGVGATGQILKLTGTSLDWASDENSGGTGDMLKATYDTDSNDIVDNAEEVGSLSSTGLVKRGGAETYTTVTDNSTNWDIAYSWGDHSIEGYLTEQAAEQDTLYSVVSRGNIAGDEIFASSITVTGTATSPVVDTQYIEYGSGDTVYVRDNLIVNGTITGTSLSPDDDIPDTNDWTEAQLESSLSDVTDVFTNNDGALNDDDVSLGDVQTATSNDFHNIGGIDATGIGSEEDTLYSVVSRENIAGDEIFATSITVDNTATATVVSFEGGTYDTYFNAGSPTQTVDYSLPPARGASGQVVTLNDGDQMIWQTPSAGGGGTSDHSTLSNLNWSAAGHTFDADLDIGTYKFIGAGLDLFEINSGNTFSLLPSAGLATNYTWYVPVDDGAGFIKSDGGGNLSIDNNLSDDVDHGSVGGLTDDDHTQYALLAGRAGGQQLVGGTNAGNTLQLFSIAATDGISVTDTFLAGNVDQSYDLGTTGQKWKDLYLANNITDDVNTVTVANLKAAYDHSQDNTQAHSDYLTNNANDSTSGTLTAAGGFIGYLTTEPANEFYFTGSETNTSKEALRLKHFTSGSLADGFGAKLGFRLETGVVAAIEQASVQTAREGANDRAELQLWNNNAGTMNEALTIHYQGITDIVDQSRARAYGANATTVNGETLIILDTENYDSQAEFTNGAGGAYKFTATVTGYYQVNYQIAYETPQDNLNLTARVKKNGTAYCERTLFTGLAAGQANPFTVGGSDVIYMAATEYIELYGDDGGTGTPTTVGTEFTFMSVHKIS